MVVDLLEGRQRMKKEPVSNWERARSSPDLRLKIDYITQIVITIRVAIAPRKLSRASVGVGNSRHWSAPTAIGGRKGLSGSLISLHSNLTHCSNVENVDPTVGGSNGVPPSIGGPRKLVERDASSVDIRAHDGYLAKEI
jgi:hypothetical protein